MGHKKSGKARSVPDELDLHRLTVEETLPKLDQYLDDAYLAGLYQVRIIHGKGTGTLRETVRRYLAHHTLVKAYRPGGHGEGDAGVTMVDLATK